MKIKEWIICGLVAMAAISSRSLGAEQKDTIADRLDQLEQVVQTTPAVTSNSAANAPIWNDLEKFQKDLWRAMALDPAPNAVVPVAEVPKELFANQLNEQLSTELDALKKSPFPKDLRTQFEFDQYIQYAQKIIEFRQNRQFPQARAIAKRGTLDSAYHALIKQLEQNSKGQAPAAAKDANATSAASALALIQGIREQIATQEKDSMKKAVFGGGNTFVWYAVAAIFGFFFGIAAYRMNPDFFQKFLDQSESTAPTATTHPGAHRLDYARWLKEFEEILSRLKSSQLTHERRVEDIAFNSEKMTQQALSLYADARIKNEANLEFRMSALLREIQHQFEQSHKLKVGDRVQMNTMLEHCLKLCDAIESNNIHLDRQQLVEPPQMRGAS